MIKDAPENILKKWGLTDYEAKVFYALLRIGEGTASEVAMVSKVPRPSVYQTLRGLINKKVVIEEKGKPTRFMAIPLHHSLDILSKNLKDEFEVRMENLEEQKKHLMDVMEENKLDGTAAEEAFWTVRGERRIWDMVKKAIEEAEEEIVLGISEDVPMVTKKIGRLNPSVHLELYIPHGVKGLPPSGFSKDASVTASLTKGDLRDILGVEFIFILLVDGKECFIALKEKETYPLRELTCLRVRSYGFYRMMKAMFRLITHFLRG